MWQKVTSDKRVLGLLTIMVLFAAVPLTLNLLQKQQDIRQRAQTAAPVCSEAGTDTILVIDKSNSMNNASSATDPVNRFQRAKEAAKKFADIIAQKNSLLPEDKKHKLAVISFSDSAQTTQDAPLTTDMTLIKQKIDAINPGNSQTGWTCLECGITKANLEFTSNRNRAALNNITILLTDGKANWLDGGASSVTQAVAEQEALNAALSGFNNSQISYFTIGLGTQQEINEVFLKNLASQTQAKYYYAPTASDLEGIYTQISQVLGKATISGTVYHDANTNGLSDTGEEKMSGWKVQLLKGSSVVTTGTTDASGKYTLTNLCNGTYDAKVTLQPGWSLIDAENGGWTGITVTEGVGHSAIDFRLKKEQTRTTLSCSPTSLTLGETSQTVQATLKDSTGAVLSSKAITWSSAQASTRLTDTMTTTNNQGIADVNVSVNNSEAAYTGKITAKFPGDTTYATSSCEVSTQFDPQSTKLLLDVYVDGIGSAGDNANPTDSSLSNKNPGRNYRTISVEIYDIQNTLVRKIESDVSYRDTGHFPFSGDLGSNFPTGQYSVLVKSEGYLTRKIPRIVTITNQTETSLGRVNLITGDVDRSNTLDILDYDRLIGCYSDYAPPISCSTDERIKTDLNDDGKVNQFDYNLFLRELSVQFGDEIVPEEEALN